MAEERVNTGGLTEIRYPKGYKTPRDIDLENRIDSAYEKYYVRKRKERIIWIAIGILVVIVALTSYIVLK